VAQAPEVSSFARSAAGVVLILRRVRLEEAVESDEAGHRRGLAARVRVGEKHAARETRDEESFARALAPGEGGRGLDVLHEDFRGPRLHRRERRYVGARGGEARAVVERVDLHSAPREEDPEVVILVGHGDLAVHVRSGEIQHRRRGSLARRAIPVHLDAVEGAARLAGDAPGRVLDVRGALDGGPRSRLPVEGGGHSPRAQGQQGENDDDHSLHGSLSPHARRTTVAHGALGPRVPNYIPGGVKRPSCAVQPPSTNRIVPVM
jgi:hypothetical protein